MKNLRLFSTALIFIISTSVYGQAQNGGNKQTGAKPTLKKLEWLIGKWKRTNVKPGQTATESWVKESASRFKGQGVVIKGNDTTFVEKLSLLVKDDQIFYVADVKENKGLVYFKLSSITSTGFVCENAEHDFPKKNCISGIRQRSESNYFRKW